MAATDGSWIERFQGLNALPSELKAALIDGAEIVEVPAGTQVFEPGRAPDTLMLLLDGTVRVQQKSETGREVFLYRVNAGESCVLTTACMLAFEEYSADGIAETDVKAVSIPREVFDDLAGRSKEFRTFIFKAYSRRLSDLFTLVDEIVFQRMDVRLADRLLGLAGQGEDVRATHQKLSTELGTAREVISRTLAEFQRQGWIEQSRGLVKIKDRDGLERMARG